MVAEARIDVDVLLARERGDARRGQVVVDATKYPQKRQPGQAELNVRAELRDRLNTKINQVPIRDASVVVPGCFRPIA